MTDLRADEIREALDEDNQLIIAMSEWINAGNPNLSEGHLMWLRLMKLAEEVGEVTTALVGAEGSNPRKGVTHKWVEVDNELLDVAATALYAYVHRSGDTEPMTALRDHLRYLDERVAALAGFRSQPKGDNK